MSQMQELMKDPDEMQKSFEWTRAVEALPED